MWVFWGETIHDTIDPCLFESKDDCIDYAVKTMIEEINFILWRYKKRKQTFAEFTADMAMQLRVEVAESVENKWYMIESEIFKIYCDDDRYKYYIHDKEVEYSQQYVLK